MQSAPSILSSIVMLLSFISWLELELEGVLLVIIRSWREGSISCCGDGIWIVDSDEDDDGGDDEVNDEDEEDGDAGPVCFTMVIIVPFYLFDVQCR